MSNYETRHPNDDIIWSASDHKDFIEVVELLGLQESEKTPVEAVQEMQAEIERLQAALRFYADPKNYVDTPSWDGDPTCITPKAIPCSFQDEGARICDCGDIARAALTLSGKDGTNG